ncbi:MAG: LysM peptidoglycan-binding domain-containing protein, partial [Bacteroidaceae bacterium]|nr:LysM peptidoglycan-binding domain-containing protein [Bacteroidaceae bacterium]
SIAFMMATLTICAQKAEIVSHTVAQGQTLYSISKLYNTTVDEIIKFNPGSAEKLSIGQKLIIPKNSKGKENKNVKTHTIQQGETLYRLSKMYNVTTDELCAANPGLSINNFRAGETIVIPVKGNAAKDSAAPVAPRQSPNEEKKPVIVGTHKVQRRESIESICKIYGITQEELIKANPVLQETKLKRKMVLHIPAPSARPAEKEIAVEEKKQEIVETINKGINDDKVLNVAVVLSFLLDSYAPKEQGRMVEYYQGFLMAVEQLKREGYSFVINTYDAGQKERSLDSLLSSSAFNDVELIIGASYPKHCKELAKFAKEREIPLLIPFSSKKDEAIDNPTVYVANGIQSFILPQISSSFVKTFPNANVIFVEDTTDNNKKEFVKSLTAELTKESIPYTTLPMELISNGDTVLNTLSNAYIEEREFVFIPTSSSATTLNTLLPSLLHARSIDSLNVANFKLFGYPEWQIHAKDTRELMYEVDTYFYATFYSHYALPRVAEFQEDFIRWYNRGIQNIYPRYGMLGYDTGYFFLLAASLYGNRMHENIDRIPFNPVQSDFKFERISEKDGFINKKFFFIHFCPEYYIDKMDFDQDRFREDYQEVIL